MKVKLRFGEHPTEPALQVIQICMDGLWYNVPGSTVHSTNDKMKAALMKSSEDLIREKGYTLCK